MNGNTILTNMKSIVLFLILPTVAFTAEANAIFVVFSIILEPIIVIATLIVLIMFVIGSFSEKIMMNSLCYFNPNLYIS